MEFDLLTPKYNNTERRKVIPKRNNSQINPRTETHNETVKKKFFETPRGESLQENQKLLTQTTRAEAQRYLCPK